MPLTENFTDASPMATDHAAAHNSVASLLNQGLAPPAIYRSGQYYDQRLTQITTTTLALAVNRVYFMPTYIGADITIDRVAVNVTAQGSAGATIGFGLYSMRTANSSVGANPDALLEDWGSAATDTIGIKSITISKALTTGWYYFALLSPAIASGTVRSIPVTGVPVYRGSGSAAPTNYPVYYYTGPSGGAFPAGGPIAGPTESNTAGPQISFRAA